MRNFNFPRDSLNSLDYFEVKVSKVMAPTMGINNNSGNGQNGDSPLSKTYQYRKIMKPMLERKRRARINRCLDELKELITGALQNVSFTLANFFLASSETLSRIITSS